MVMFRCPRVKGGRRARAAAAVMAVLGAACSPGDPEPVDLDPSISAAPSVATTEVDAEALQPQPATDPRPLPQSATDPRRIISGDGSFPVYLPTQQPPDLPSAISIYGGRIWVPWPPYPDPAETDAQQVSGSHSELDADVQAGRRFVVERRARWDTMPPYLPSVQAAFAEGTRVARRRAGTESAWELVVDTAGLSHETRLTEDRSAAYDHVSLCPPHPTAEVLGVDVGDTPAERDRAGAAIAAFIVGMRSPGGRPMHSWGTTVNNVALLLVYSPGEPMELALGGHSHADIGLFPGDWSTQAKQWLTRRAAQGAVTDSLVGHAVLSVGPETLWEACSDLATIIPGVYTASHRTQRLESLWARGLRLEFTAPPVERAWIADISSAGHALAVVCHEPGQSFLIDASTGERLDAGAEHPAQVEAMWLTWSRHSYRVLRNALFEGACESEAFGRAVQWLAEAKDTRAATVDWTEPRAWGSGVRNQWIAVREWVEVPQSEAWQAHRDNGWHLAFWCQTGIPNGTLVNGELRRPELEPHCTPAQWSAMAEAAADAPEVTTELSATIWETGASWHERMYLSPFKSLEQVLGCPADPDLIEEALARPIERQAKKPWPPGSLPLTEAGRAYPRPMPPCPQAGWPPQTDRYWWPASAPLAEASPAEASS